MVVNLEYFIKKIRLNGGKTPPLIAEAFDKVNTELKLIRGQVEGTLCHKALWEAATQCHLAGQELEAARHATGFITREELDGQLKRSDIETALWCAATAVITAVVTAVLHG